MPAERAVRAPALAEAIEMNEKGEPIILADKCIGCQKCVEICPAEALEMFFTPEEMEILKQLAAEKGIGGAPVEEEDYEEAKLKNYLAQYRGVWVFVEQTDCIPARVSWELLGVGANWLRSFRSNRAPWFSGTMWRGSVRKHSPMGQPRHISSMIPYCHYYRTGPYLESICYLVEKYKPEIVLMGATGLGRDLAGAVATKLRTGLTADCTGLDIDEKGLLLQTRPAFGGNIMATIVCEQRRPQMASVRPHVMPMPIRIENATGEIIREQMTMKEEDVLTKVLDVISDADQKDSVDIVGARSTLFPAAGA